MFHHKKTKYLYLISALFFSLSFAKNNPQFKAFKPDGCVMNNDHAGIKGTCKCIRDTKTDNIWLVNPAPPKPTWDDAAAWADNLNTNEETCGLHNWRLPSHKQLIDIAKYANNDPLWFNNNGFSGLGSGTYWGELKLPIGVNAAWTLWISSSEVVATLNGIKGDFSALAIHSRFEPFYPTGCSISKGDCQCIQDIDKGYVWQTKPTDNQIGWIEATKWANNMNALGVCGLTNGWQLPSSMQLKTMSGYLHKNAAYKNYTQWLNKEGFNKIQNDMYWGNEEVKIKNRTYAKALSIPDVKIYDFPQISKNYGWAVNPGIAE